MKLRPATTAQLHTAMREYLGIEGDLVMIAIPDPSFDGVYAVRVTLEPKHGFSEAPMEKDFLLTRTPRTTFNLKDHTVPFDVDEVEFTVWPPRQRP